MLGVLDQALSSLGNFAFTVIGAVLLDASSFGQIAVAFAIYLLANGLVRSFTSDVYVVTARDVVGRPAETEVSCIKTSVVVSVVATIIICLAAAVTAPTLRGPLLVLGCCLPFLALQDVLRYIAFGRSRPSFALINDALWTGSTLVVVWLLATLDVASATSLVAAWAVTGAFAGILSSIFMGIPWSLFVGRGHTIQVRRWLSDHRRLYPYYAVDSVAAQASGPLALFLLTAISGLEAGGALRAAQLLFNPVVVLVNSVRVWAIPELVRARRKDDRTWRKRSLQLTVALTAAAATWSLAVVLAPSSLVHALLGDSALLAERLLWPTGIVIIVTGGIAMPMFAAIRSVGEAQWGLWARLVSAVAMLGGCALGASVAAAYGAAWGLASAMPVVACIWGYALRCSVLRANPT